MRSDAPAFCSTFTTVSEPDYTDYYDVEMFQTRRMTRSMSMYYHPKINPREYP